MSYFCDWYKIGVQFHSSSCRYPVFPTPFNEEPILSTLHLFGSLSNINWPYMSGFISGLSVLFHSSTYLFLCHYHTFLYFELHWCFNPTSRHFVFVLFFLSLSFLFILFFLPPFLPLSFPFMPSFLPSLFPSLLSPFLPSHLTQDWESHIFTTDSFCRTQIFSFPYWSITLRRTQLYIEWSLSQSPTSVQTPSSLLSSTGRKKKKKKQPLVFSHQRPTDTIRAEAKYKPTQLCVVTFSCYSGIWEIPVFFSQGSAMY